MASGCSKSEVDSINTSAKATTTIQDSAQKAQDSTTSPQKSSSVFSYTIDIPNRWQTVKSDSFSLELSAALSNEKDFINPYLTIYKPVIGKESEEDFANNALKGTTSNIKLKDVADLTKFNVNAFECKQNSAHKEYTCYYAFITTDTDFIVIHLLGDSSIKDKLKLVFYNAIRTLKKN